MAPPTPVLPALDPGRGRVRRAAGQAELVDRAAGGNR